ncbi:MAG: hypothetical protein WBC91_17700, partial [Phototrophicaceae bacterium]
ARRLIILVIGIAMSIIIARVVGQQVNPYPPLSIYRNIFGMSERSELIFDPVTYVSYVAQLPNISFAAQSQSNSELGISYRYEWINETSYIYITRNEEEVLVGTVPTQTRQVEVRWDFDDNEPLYIVSRNSDGDSVTVHQMDTQTGESTTLDNYPFSQTPTDVYIQDNHLFITRLQLPSNFLIINPDTGEFYGDKILGSLYNTSSDQQFLQYTNSANPANIRTLDRRHYLLDLDSYTSTEIIITEGQAAINQVLRWSPNALVLPYIDVHSQLWLYDVPTQTATPLHQDLRFYDFNFDLWSNDGNSILLLKILDGESLAYGIYRIETQDFVTFFTLEQSVETFQQRNDYHMWWSPDYTMILIYDTDEDTYQIYDTATGDLLLDESLPFGFSFRTEFLQWRYDLTRP